MKRSLSLVTTVCCGLLATAALARVHSEDPLVSGRFPAPEKRASLADYILQEIRGHHTAVEPAAEGASTTAEELLPAGPEKPQPLLIADAEVTGSHSRTVSRAELRAGRGGGSHSRPVSAKELKAGAGSQGYRSRPVGAATAGSPLYGYKSRPVRPAQALPAGWAVDHSRPVTAAEIQRPAQGGFHSAPASSKELRAATTYDGFRSRPVAANEIGSSPGYRSKPVAPSAGAVSGAPRSRPVSAAQTQPAGAGYLSRPVGADQLRPARTYDGYRSRSISRDELKPSSGYKSRPATRLELDSSDK